jgi:hypothetical protein
VKDFGNKPGDDHRDLDHPPGSDRRDLDERPWSRGAEKILWETDRYRMVDAWPDRSPALLDQERIVSIEPCGAE